MIELESPDVIPFDEADIVNVPADSILNDESVNVPLEVVPDVVPEKVAVGEIDNDNE